MTLCLTAFVPAPEPGAHPLSEAFAGHHATAFSHVPRPPQTSHDYPKQRWYTHSASTPRIRLQDPDAHVNLVSDLGHPHADLTITRYTPSGSLTVSVNLPSEALRELARCCIDAAADIERGQPAPTPAAPAPSCGGAA